MSEEPRIGPECKIGDAAAYALGALDPDEAEAFRRHLETCAACRDELAALAPLTGSLAIAAPQYPPPPELRRRVLEQVDAEPRDPGRGHAEAPPQPARVRRRRALLAGALLAGVVAIVLAGVGILSGGGNGTRVYTATVGHARLYVSGGHGDLVVSRLARASSGHIYEVWLLAGHRAPRPAGLFSVGVVGRCRVHVSGDLHGVSAVAVTQEPTGGTLRPTTKPVIVTPIT
jgi:anti-sigma-K factor RskA